MAFIPEPSAGPRLLIGQPRVSSTTVRRRPRSLRSPDRGRRECSGDQARPGLGRRRRSLLPPGPARRWRALRRHSNGRLSSAGCPATPRRPSRLCICKASILHASSRALVPAISAIAAAVMDELGLPVPAWPVLSEGSSPGYAGAAAALVLATQAFVANGGRRPSGRRPQSAASPGRTGSRGSDGRRDCWRSKTGSRSRSDQTSGSTGALARTLQARCRGDCRSRRDVSHLSGGRRQSAGFLTGGGLIRAPGRGEW
jgi:hypothetical protein